MDAVELRLRIYELLKDSPYEETYEAAEIAAMLKPKPKLKSVGIALKALDFTQVSGQRWVSKPYCFCAIVGTPNTSTVSTRTAEGQKNWNELQAAGFLDKPEKLRGWSRGHGRNGCGTELVREPAQWRRPGTWPPILEVQQGLQRQGISATAIARHTSAAAEVPDILLMSLEDVLADGGVGSATRRGLLARQIRETIKSVYADAIPRASLAAKLGERPDAPKEALLSRVGGLTKVVDRRDGVSRVALATALRSHPDTSGDDLIEQVEDLRRQTRSS